jgi:hypothetical protein
MLNLSIVSLFVMMTFFSLGKVFSGLRFLCGQFFFFFFA